MSKPVPFNEAPDARDPALRNLFKWMREHPGWKNKPPGSGGVTWDMRCERCGFTLEDQQFDSSGGVTGNGRTVVQRITNLRDYNPVLCTVCHPLPGRST